MSTRDFLVPDLGEGLQDATITSWNVDVGDTVELNQTLCTVETNKAEVEIPSPYAGKVEALGGAAGDTLAVGSLLVRIATSSDEPVEAQPMNGEVPQRKSVLVGYGADDSMDASRRRTHGPRARAKPPVRKLAAELNVDLGALDPGSGPDGIITRDDVLAAAGRSPAAQSAGTPQPSQTRDVRGCRPRWRDEWRCRAARSPMHTHASTSTAPRCCDCVTASAAPRPSCPSRRSC